LRDFWFNQSNMKHRLGLIGCQHASFNL
jgi:hypothetical protein